MHRTLALLSLLATHAALAQMPSVSNAAVQTHAATSGSLDTQLRSFGSAAYWVGYQVAAIPGNHRSCGDLESWHSREGINLPVKLEGSRELFVLFRVEGQKIRKTRLFSGDCPLDAGGLPLHWLTGVSPSASVQMLAAMVQSSSADPQQQPRGEALAALALHADPSAEAALTQFVAPAEQSMKLRREGVFWLIQRQSRSGFQTVQRIAKEDRDDRVREHAIFSLTQSREPEAIPTIIEIARTDHSQHVRGQALFWLAQKAGNKALPTISDSIDHDPDTEIKKKAVFALTQMPDGQGLPKLIEVAQSHPNPAVRKQAMFWLGQSKDPRALDFFEKVLRSN